MLEAYHKLKKKPSTTEELRTILQKIWNELCHCLLRKIWNELPQKTVAVATASF